MQIVDFDSSKISIREIQKIHSLCRQVIRWSVSRLIQFNRSKMAEHLIRNIKILFFVLWKPLHIAAGKTEK